MLRRLRFWVLQRILLPPGLLALRLLMRTWRVETPGDEHLRDLAMKGPLVCVTYHGMLLPLLAFADLAARYGRRFVVMVSPSLDGRLLAAGLDRFGVGHVRGTTGRRGTAGALEFIRRVEAGDVGIIAVDGPLGPRGVVQPGALRIAAASGAHVVAAVTSATYGITFPSWDRAHLPGPFARVRISAELLPPVHAEATEEARRLVESALRGPVRHRFEREGA